MSQPCLTIGIFLGMVGRDATPAPDDLSQREVDVLRLIALGNTTAEIGERLCLSAQTVETHRAHIQQKLRLSTRAELVQHALKHGLISTGPSEATNP
jgi:two-component system, NarL family, response regulator NreC